ncbi:MAG: hypothetical protein FWD31_05375 [Planctomycetaceae bacterium]|nr:hypothetical protein [Planctomycetaceae bacterium]
MCRNCLMNRREFVETAGVLAAGTLFTSSVLLGENASGFAPDPAAFQWDPDAPIFHPCKTLKVQPVLMYRDQPFRERSSYKSWGRVNSKETAEEEERRIGQELRHLKASANFAVEFLPLITVTSPEEAQKIHDQDYDVVLLYAATGGGDLFSACVAPAATRDTIVFVRHRNGPIYYWYEALSDRFLRPTDHPELAQNSADNHGPLTVEDVVVDDFDEVLWRLRALYALKNFVGHKTVAIGGADGKYDGNAPANCQSRFKHEIIEVSYEQFEKRYREFCANPQIVAKAEAWTDLFLQMPHTKLETQRDFIARAFLVYGVFKELLTTHQASTLTVLGCMGTMFNAADTTACLSLGWLNDEGYLGLCESDFVLVPAAILMRYVANKPVFMHNSTFPHSVAGRFGSDSAGMVTCAHCASPRRMDGIHYDPMRIMTHYESDFGASPKVDFPIGQKVTFLDPHYSNPRWLTFTGTVLSNPDFEICRSQQDVLLDGDWKKLMREARDSHWTMSFGDYKNEVEYISRKIGVQCVRIDG